MIQKPYLLGLTDYPAIMRVWEAAVRHTHDFLAEADIQALREQLPEQILPGLTLYGVTRQNRLCGFIGIADDSIEALFIDPVDQGCGIGSQLLVFAVTCLHCCRVEVNEQNPAAMEFYQKHGFVPDGRSAVDHQGRPFPLLSLRKLRTDV